MHFLPIYVSYLCLYLFGIKVKVHNKSLLNKDEQYILIGNHMSYLDALISAVASDNYKKYIGKAEILNYPVVGYLLKKLYVPVKREEKESRKWSMEAMYNYMQDGVSMVIFPEGTCNTTPKLLKEFKDGAFSLSRQLGVPIAICAIKGAAECMPRKLLSIRPGIVQVHWLKVINPKDFNTLEEMKATSKEIIYKKLLEFYPNEYQ